MGKPIPDGQETHRLIEAGFKNWGDLYTDRQAHTIETAINVVLGLDVSNECKDRLALAVIGLAEMPAYLCRWDRYNLKAFEGLANHQYSDSTLVVETNFLSPLGRGTLPARLRLAAKAIDWVNKEIPYKSRPQKIDARRKPATLSNEIIIATGSSDKQALKNGQINLVLTDPPYYGDIQYGELSHLFHFWLSEYQPVSKYSVTREAVPNSFRGAGSDFYIDSIAKCLRESARTLAPRGRLIITFHNRKFQAWQSLAKALIRARFIILSLAVVQAENDADFRKHAGNGMLHDIVFECGRRREWRGYRTSVLGSCCDDRYHLRTMGVAISKAIRKRCPESLARLYKAELKKQGIKEIAIV